MRTFSQARRIRKHLGPDDPRLQRRRPYRFAVAFMLTVVAAHQSPSARADIDQQILEVMRTNNIGALAYGIVSPEETLIQKAHGHYSIKRLRHINLDSIFRIGSISKTFTALSALVLQAQSDFRITHPVRRHLSPPPFNNRWPKQRPITTAMLLEHTAGFRDLSKIEFDQLHPLPLAEALTIDPNSRTTHWPPGLHCSYSNSGAGIVAAVIESVTGLSFTEYAAEHVLTPLGLFSATFSPPPDLARDLVQGYDSDGRTPIPYWHQLYPAFGSLNVSTRDMLRFVQTLLDNGNYADESLISASIVEKLTTISTGLSAELGLKYGYAKGLYQFQRKGVSFYGHGGDADGYLAFLGFSRELQRGYYIVINAYQPQTMRDLRRILESHLTSDANPVFPDEYAMSKVQLDALMGRYRQVTYRFGDAPSDKILVVFANRAGEIFTRLASGEPKRLVPVSNNTFRRNDQTIATIALVDHAQHFYLLGDFGNFQKLR
ncbi:MAG: serine hydrolase domain-containing protein [Gammaproteobacteria bacterium]